MDKKQREIGFGIGGIICLCAVVVIGGGLWYREQPVYQLQKYMSAMNQRDYSKVYDTFLSDNIPVQLSKEEVIAYMTRYGQDLGLIKLEKGKMRYTSKDKAFYEVIYCTNKGRIAQVISLVNKQDTWQVIFPFKTYTLGIEAPEGTSVRVNGREILSTHRGEYALEVLPGEYTVRMTYPNGLQADYVSKVKVPQVTQVISPYEMMPVIVEAPSGTIVELAGVQKESQNGAVVFDKVLEGAYELKVFDQKGYIEPITQQIQVKKEMAPLSVQKMSVSEQGEESFKQFIGKFYDDYLKSIRIGDSTVLEKYLDPTSQASTREEFESWFIAQKHIRKADMTIEIDELKVDPCGGVKANLLEVVTMTNVETLGSGEKREKEYQVMLRWDTRFGIGETGYQLESREIVESVVSQKDSKGNWVQY
ncbi:MAG: hypothetical protein ACRCW2_09945 [Cellulosilyticaceae bacterium]